MSHIAETILKEAIVNKKDRKIYIDLWYPTVEDNIEKFVVGLVDVRAADSIQISYDHKRDGWKIEQASTFEWDADDKECDEDWQEVAFIEAWAREKNPKDESP